MSELVFHVIIVMEMVFVNLITVHTCSKKKHSNLVIAAVMLLVTAALVGIGMPLLMRWQNYGNGNGLFVLVGFLYLVPLGFLYDQPKGRTVSVICSAWMYSMLAFSVSLHLSKLFFSESFSFACLVVQTLLCVVTYPLFHKFIRTYFLYMLQNMSQKISKKLRLMSLCGFITIVAVNFTFVIGGELFMIVSMLLLGCGFALSLSLLYDVIKSSQNVENLKKVVYTDQLTDLPNRNAMQYEADKLIRAKQPFVLVFFDLDSFKSVNDRYGHLIGDEYLRAFAARCRETVERGGGMLFRISGDEFVALCPCGVKSDSREEPLNELGEAFFEGLMGNIPFFGVSYGQARYPVDAATLDGLLLLADQKMYQSKHRKRAKEK